MEKSKSLNIGFEAKRVFFNRSGLGNYSRDLIRIMSKQLPENHYYLFKHKDAEDVPFELSDNMSIVLPSSKFHLKYGSYWRSFAMSADIKKYSLDIFHGLSQELPFGIEKTGVKTVVTIHDCIFMRYPELFDLSYRIIFKKKYAYACKVADRVIAISEQTKQDIIHYLNVPADKIYVVYQGCNSAFYDTVSDEVKATIREKYELPDEYILYVGSIEERKNLLSVFEAMVKGNIKHKVVAIGKSTDYSDKVKAFVQEHQIEAQFIHDADFTDFPAIYQMAKVFVYPSIFEGFGIPILEAMNSGVPVVTTRGGVFPEVGGDAAAYVEYGNTDMMVDVLSQLLSNAELRGNMAEVGRMEALRFREEEISNSLMAVYRNVL